MILFLSCRLNLKIFYQLKQTGNILRELQPQGRLPWEYLSLCLWLQKVI
nr:MAG TPA: hypothetical protein [Caudoviricetes sp.]DAZ36874.1 MAG TPA: hypothetical protein [Caudoviricetes sp.]